jgi:hypothetical protein
VTDFVAYDWHGQVESRLPDGKPTPVAPDDFELNTLGDVCATTFPKTAPHGAFERVRGDDPEVDAYRFFEKAGAERMARWPWPSSRLPPEGVDCSRLRFRYAATLAELTPELREAAPTGGMAGGELTDDERRDLLGRLTVTRDKQVMCARASLDRFIRALTLRLQAQ